MRGLCAGSEVLKALIVKNMFRLRCSKRGRSPPPLEKIVLHDSRNVIFFMKIIACSLETGRSFNSRALAV
jgi:hypothetical protein